MPLPARVLILARPASTVAALALVFLLGFRLACERSDLKQLARDLAFARQQIDNIAATADDAERAPPLEQHRLPLHCRLERREDEEEPEQVERVQRLARSSPPQDGARRGWR